uniref:Uncharacterized protein n=1 Tax=Rhizophora mucronata TaxID=61149 RepID=A0A2P2NJ43_RHIMU
MFWNIGGISASSPVETILDKENFKEKKNAFLQSWKTTRYTLDPRTSIAWFRTPFSTLLTLAPADQFFNFLQCIKV